MRLAIFLDLIETGATWQLLEQSVHIHPTYGEALPSLARLLIDNTNAIASSTNEK
jgi:dihydrolipoamide dehydrogenase